MKQRSGSAKKNIANFFGSLGYLFCFLQWFWAVMLYFSVVQSVTLLVYSNADKPVQQSSGFTLALPGSLEMIIVGIVTAVMIAVTIYVLIKIPMSVVKTGNKIVHKTAETITPMVIQVQHKKDTKKFHALVTAKVILVIKSLLIVVPVVLTITSGLLEKQSIDYSIAVIIGCWLAGFAVALFVVQYILAGLFRINKSDIW